MKQGITLSELAVEIERQQDTKRDFNCPTTAIEMQYTDLGHQLVLSDTGAFGINEHAHAQLATHLSIPKPYYDRMLVQSPELLSDNVNHWLHQENEQRLVRTLDNRVRAYLSRRYRTLDNHDLANAVLPALSEENDLHVVSCAITDTNMYIKAVTPRLEADMYPGLGVKDVVQGGIVISNSEVGLRALQIRPLLYRLVCLNGAVSSDAGIRKHHLGKQSDFVEDVQEFLSDETKALNDQAFWHTARDVVKAVLSQTTFEKIVDQWRGATKQAIEGDPQKVIEVTAKQFRMTDGERKGVLRHLIEGGELTRYGLANAITRTSQDVDSYDRATDLEQTGAQIIEMSQPQWEALQVVA